MLKLALALINVGILILASFFKSKRLQKLSTVLQVIECTYLVLTA